MNFEKINFLNIKMEEDEEDEKPQIDNIPGSVWARKQEELFLKNRSIYLWGPVDDKSAKDIVNRLLLLDADQPGEEIKMFINSPGGMVTSGFVIHDVMTMIKSPVSTICMGMAASMASILLSAGTKGRRFVFPHGEVMIHQPSLGGFFRGVSADLEIQAIQIQKTKELGTRIIAENCGQDFDKVLRDMERDYYMDAQEAIEYGIVDKIIDKL
ncbi:MAG TPA: ATP-dependent Clp protease proteolytic subunit [Edaphocola sp.]|nr:ATP-dependent Clp protease proteolytic subunit [Edaphocola sp.]